MGMFANTTMMPIRLADFDCAIFVHRRLASRKAGPAAAPHQSTARTVGRRRYSLRGYGPVDHHRHEILTIGKSRQAGWRPDLPGLPSCCRVPV